MKKLVVYYSFEGNTDMMAKAIKDAVGADILRLEVLKEKVPKKGFMKYFWGGGQVVMKEKPALKNLEIDPCEYDLIFIGTPVWAFSFAPAIATLFDQVKLHGKKVALFACHEGGLGKTFDKMKVALEGSDIVGTKDFIAPLMKNDLSAKEVASDWAKSMVVL